MSVRALAIALSLLPVAAAAQSGDVVVSAAPEQMSDWRRAETPHVVVYSDGSEADLMRVTRTLERLHHLLNRLYRGDAGTDDTLPLQVMLPRQADAVLLPTAAVVPGTGRRRYLALDDGPILIVERQDQAVDLNTNLRFNKDCDDLLMDTARGFCGSDVPHHPSVARPWEAVVYADYARHFILTHRPALYPAWYLDGIGALFSTVLVRNDGAMDYATAPAGYLEVLRSYGDLDIAGVLGARRADAPTRMRWTPYHAWLLAHFFLFSDAGAAQQAVLQRYLTSIHQGVPPSEAAAAFGDLRKLQGVIARYARRTPSFARSTAEPTEPIDPLVTRLSVGSADLLAARLSMATGNVAPNIAWLPQIAGGAVLRAEADCRVGRDADCLAAADRALASSPDDVVALTWKGTALSRLAIAGPPAGRADGLVAARRALNRAIAVDGRVPSPHIALFDSYVSAGERVPAAAIAGMAAVVRTVPTAPHPRLVLAEELVRQGNIDLGRRLLQSVLGGGDDSAERRKAVAMLQTLSPSPDHP